MRKEIFFYILIRHWKSFEYFDRCINSVLNQTYKNYKILFVDDNSNYTIRQINHIKNKLVRQVVCFNGQRKYSLRNAYEMIHRYANKDDAVVVNLDGDDWFLDKKSLTFLNEIYCKNSCFFTYGECLIWNGNSTSKMTSRHWKKYTNIPYPNKIINLRAFRNYPFLPLHPRTWKVKIFKEIPKENFFRDKYNWFRFCEDQVIFFPLLEKYPRQCKVINKALYVYNIFTKYADNKINLKEQISEENIIRRKHL